MKLKSTYDDASLILQLYEMRREEKLRQARGWFARSFKATTMEEFQTLCPQGSETNSYYLMVTSYWEMLASFIEAGVLNRELFFQSGLELLYVWERMRDIVPAYRQAMKNPFFYTNLESVAESMIQWMNGRAPESYSAFSAMARQV
jgi:hypothetical protein